MTVLRIPRDRLPSSPSERHAALRDYFCDKDAEATLEPEHWALRLAWPDGEDRYIDPRLDEGLAWWGDGVTRPTMAMAIRRQGPILSALYDTWTLYSWSQWFADRHPQSADDIVILHIDDHRDLSAPRLFGDADQWRDSITGAICSVDKPDSVHCGDRERSAGYGKLPNAFSASLSSRRRAPSLPAAEGSYHARFPGGSDYSRGCSTGTRTPSPGNRTR